MQNKKTRIVLGVIVVAVLTAIRIVLAYKTAICPHTYAVLDDELLINQGRAIWGGQWLGAYSSLTLAKNPGYGLMLAAFRALGMRYQLGFVLLLCFSSAVAAQSLRPLVPSRVIRAGMYVFLIYAPVFITTFFFQRVYRNGAATIAALLLFSSFVGLYLRRRESLRAMLPWAILAGLSLGFFSIVQESAAWVLPFVGACTGVMAVATVVDFVRYKRESVLGEDSNGSSSRPDPQSADAPDGGAGVSPRAVPQQSEDCLSTGDSRAFLLRERPPREGTRTHDALDLAARLLFMALPLALYGLTLFCISSINMSCYGIGVVNDKYQGEFARATANIMKIDVGYPDQRVWISDGALEEALKASPTLAQIEPELRESWKMWQETSSGAGFVSKDTPQVPGDHPYWALRDAYELHGGYKNASETERYWGVVADEIEAAFSAGTLKPKTGLFVSQTTQPMPLSSLPTWIVSSLRLMNQYAWGELFNTILIRPLPDTDVYESALQDQLDAREILGDNTLFVVRGELYEDNASKQAQPWLKLSNRLGRVLFLARRVFLVLFLAGVLVLLVMDIRTRNRDGIRSALILVGMYLSSFVLVFGASWMISFLSTGESAVAAGNVAFSYCSSVYSLLALGECLVFGRIAQMLLERKVRA